MTTPKLGRLEKLDLRDAWKNEAGDFTPWLASEENIKLLGDAMNLDLEVQQQEAQVGPFRADILCRNTADNSLVLVENQLERTDHRHLGQLFTYAAGLDAVAVVWIASQFTEEHRAAMDWLNRITHDGFHFFGLEIELWRIGESEPAPKFNIVAKPNDWSKVVKEASSGGGERTPSQQKQAEFWTDFGKVIEESGSGWKVPKPQPATWVGYGIGRSGFGLYPTVAVNDGWAAVRLTMSDANAEAYFHLLQAEQHAIEQELGIEVSWLEKPGRNHCTIEARAQGSIDKKQDRRRLMVWMLQTMDAFERVFRHRIKTLDAADWAPTPE